MPWTFNPFTGNLDWEKDADVLAHSLGGADHTADTLANLNTKVSDATLIDKDEAIMWALVLGG